MAMDGESLCALLQSEVAELRAAMAARDAYDVIFMDCSMPGMDGFRRPA